MCETETGKEASSQRPSAADMRIEVEDNCDPRIGSLHESS